MVQQVSTKRNDCHRRHRKAMKDAFLVLREQLRDLFAASEAHELDAADDKKWFAAHPLSDARHRLPTSREMAAYGLPPGCTAVVARGPMGTQIRMFYPPRN